MPVRLLIWIVPFDLLRIRIESELMYLTYKWYVVTIAESITTEKTLASRRTVRSIRTRDTNEEDGCRDKLYVFVLLP